jgi:hypothetical protein
MCTRTRHIKKKQIHILWIDVDENEWNNLNNIFFFLNYNLKGLVGMLGGKTFEFKTN